MDPSDRARAQRRRIRELVEAKLRERGGSWRACTRSPLLVTLLVIVALATLVNWESIRDRLSPASPPSESAPAAPSVPPDDVLVQAVDSVFDEPSHDCLSRIVAPVAAGGDWDQPAAGCLVRGDYVDLEGHAGSVLIGFFYPAEDLTPLTDHEARGPVADWVRTPGELLGYRPQSCRDWRNLHHAVPEAAQATGCERQTALDVYVRVVLASEEALAVVDLVAELDPSLSADRFPDAAHAQGLALDIARRVLAEV